jgi:hypothetical protein
MFSAECLAVTVWPVAGFPAQTGRHLCLADARTSQPPMPDPRQIRTFDSLRVAASDGQLHPALRWLVSWPTLRYPLVDESRSLVRLSRASVIAANHQVDHAVPASGPARHRIDESPGNTLASSCRSHPHGDELDQFSSTSCPLTTPTTVVPSCAKRVSGTWVRRDCQRSAGASTQSS